MKVGIMQPYLFPYVGYWQLIHAVDKFVILDDVNYIMRGYINRNSILLDGKPYRFTIPVKKASQNKLIMETKLNFDAASKEKFLKLIHNAYHKAPYFDVVFPVIEGIILNAEEDLTRYIYKSIKDLSHYMQINTEFYISSQLKKDSALRGQERIIEICKKLHANCYINPCGGRKLYCHADFASENMKLFFLDTKDIFYDQHQQEFVKNLSIIDILMFNDVDAIRNILEMYDLNS